VVVRDVEDGELYWGDAKDTINAASQNVGTIRLVPDSRLTPDGLDEFLEAAQYACSAQRSDPLLNLDPPCK